MSPVQQYAIENSLPQLIWPDVGGERCKYDVGVVDSFGHLIPDNVINMFTYGLLNIHPSLLPRWRGAAPLYHTILSGDEETGVTIIQISPQFDVGPIVMQTTITVPHRCTTIQLSKILSQLGSNMLLQVLDDLPRKIENSVVQPTNGVTLAKKIKTDMSWIDWCNYSCRFIDRLHRAISTHVTLRTLWRGKLLKLYNMVDLHVTQGLQLPLADVHPGVVKYHNKHGILCIRCLDGWVGFKSVTIERRKKMSAKDFYNGFLSRDQSLDWNNFTSVRNKHTEALNKKYGT
uniref:Methionyl-tRNA formyltransferase, mitochondrial n=1 Tax=Saccoglossus kowalevskii TaxID=10224 RepID=A0ABM0M1I5_SACKO|nr:PREDICTED: methionyl-tRNA formyltransferase, mitochondrial-like [Saccoglossus kowalevskii]